MKVLNIIPYWLLLSFQTIQRKDPPELTCNSLQNKQQQKVCTVNFRFSFSLSVDFKACIPPPMCVYLHPCVFLPHPPPVCGYIKQRSASSTVDSHDKDDKLTAAWTTSGDNLNWLGEYKVTLEIFSHRLSFSN